MIEYMSVKDTEFKKIYMEQWYDKRNDVIYIESPFIWNIINILSDLSICESMYNLDIDRPIFLQELNFKLLMKLKNNGSLNIVDNIKKIIGGEFKRDGMGRYYFEKDDKKILPEDTSIIEKYYGIFQVLSKNNRLRKNTTLYLQYPYNYVDDESYVNDDIDTIIGVMDRYGINIIINTEEK